MSAPCPPKAPLYYTTFLHIIATISFPINILGLYLVLYKSPGLSRYKYCIFYVQFTAFLTEIQMSVVAPAYYFFPLLAGFNTNELVARVVTNNHVLMTVWLFFLANELPAVIWCFVYRHNAAEDMNMDRRNSRVVKKFALTSGQLFPFILAYVFYYSDITKNEAKVYLTNNYPQCLFWLDSPAFAIYDWRTNSLVAVSGIGALITVFLYFLYAVSLAIRTMLLLNRLRSHMSPQTYRMHRTALIALSLQVIVPSVLLVLPLGIVFWVIFFEQKELQGLATNSTILISLHSVSSTIMMIAANPRYRMMVAGWFCKICMFYNQTTATVEPSSTNMRRSIDAR